MKTFQKNTAAIDDFKIEKLYDKRWTVVKTKARGEKKFAEYCRNRLVTYFLPLRRSIRRYRNRTVEFMIPMFSGYVFTQIDPNQKITLLESRQSAQLITPDEHMEEILIKELNDIQRLITATLEGKIIVRPEIQVGKYVCIKSGILAGLKGIVSYRNNKTRVTVNVEMIGYSVSVDLDVGELDIEF